MDTIEAILTRKSVRQFEEKEIEEDKIELLLKSAMAAPSAINRQPWEFYVCKSTEAKEAIKKAMPFGKYNASIIIITCVKEISTIPFMHDLAYCDLGAATENILLAAHELGLGAVWCAVYPDKIKMKNIKKAINIPVGITPYSAIYIGYPAKDNRSVIKDKFDNKRIHVK